MTEKKEYRVDDVVKRYREIKLELDNARKEWQTKELELKTKIERLSMWLREKADLLGVNSFNTPYGTAYRSEKAYARILDWDKFIDYVIKTDNTQMLEKRLAKIATMDILDKEKLDPITIGVEISYDIDFLVRKPSKPTKG